ncbi:hypothetical protein M422DRAFT_23790 [Sphaerobolus stellatus SS14]|nr:hypothetical protein M422DRAFT_23790 [Sphaerobolus stellatus SS14]
MTTTVSNATLQDALQAEYPLLDPPLLAAFISELPVVNSITDDAVNELRATLGVLSINAEQEAMEEQFLANEQFSSVDTSSRQESDGVHDSEISSSYSPDELPLSTSHTTGSISSTSSSPSNASSTAADFLQILFPHLSGSLIRQALQESHFDDASNNTDMAAVVDHLLSLEYIQDLAERGLDALSDEESDVDLWQVATPKGKHVPLPTKTKKRQTKKAVPLVDIRQRQHIIRETSVREAATQPGPRAFSEDPWTRLSSLAARASELLPPTAPGYFMSYFHAPKFKLPNSKTGWKAEADALRQALTDLIAQNSITLEESELKTRCDTLTSIALSASLDGKTLPLNPEEKAQIGSDARLCIIATRGDADAALDLVWLLRELDEAFELGNGVAHVLPLKAASIPSPSPTNGTSAKTPNVISHQTSLLAQPPPALPPPLSHKHPPSKASRHSRTSQKGHTWTVVQPRRPISSTPHPHAEFIPAYANNHGRNRPLKGSGNQFGKGGKGDVGELGNGTRNYVFYHWKAGDLQSQREEALREASRHWNNGSKKSRGGEVALFYAEKARELQAQQRKWALDAARSMVEEKRAANRESNIIDLHGLTIEEACVIVKEVTTASLPSPSNPLKIITGRGNHSAGQVGVLGPAVREMLVREGYSVTKWDAGLVVRGMK